MYSHHPADFSPSEMKRAHLEDESTHEQPASRHPGDTVPLDGEDTGRGRFGRKRPKKPKQAKKREPGPLKRILNRWWDRLLGAVKDKSLSEQEEEYQAHRTGGDYIWNTAGYMAWGIVFPILTIVVTQLVGVERAGMFSLVFVTANLLYFLGNYGVRTYQVSDIDGVHSFRDYQVNRWLTVIAMLAVGFVYCLIRGYSDEMLGMCVGIFIYKAIDALGDVYEGRLQQVDKLYLGGISLTLRSVAAFLVFSVVLFVSRSLVAASVGMAIAALVTFVVVTFPLALLETPKSGKLSFASVGQLFKQCAPLFIALFLFNLIDNMPKFAMDGVLSYDNQLYFNAMFFPAQAILLTAGFIYKPLLVRMAKAWADVDNRRKFDLFIVSMMVIIVVLTVLAVIIMGWIGIPIMSFLYGVDFGEYRTLSFIMLAAGGVTAGIDFLYQVITILRRQKVVTELYLITFVFSVVILILLIRMTGLDGAVIGYLVTMLILFVLLLREYIIVRLDFARHPDHDFSTQSIPVVNDDENVASRRVQMFDDEPEYAPAARTQRMDYGQAGQAAPSGRTGAQASSSAYTVPLDDFDEREAARRRLAARQNPEGYSEEQEQARSRLRKRLNQRK